MNKFEEVNIKAKLKANPILLLTIWLLLIIIPYLVLSEIIDLALKESENRLLNKAKVNLIDEISEFHNDLNTTNYLNKKFINIPSSYNYKTYNAKTLTHSIENYTKSKVAALFYLNLTNNTFDSYVSEKLYKDLGFFSKYSMKNLLLAYGDNIVNSSQDDRYVNYFQQLLSAAGGINLKQEESAFILSGKPNLGKMITYYKTFESSNNEKHIFLSLFRLKDIPFKEVINNALNNGYGNSVKREIIFEKKDNGKDEDYNEISKSLFRFQFNKDEGLSLLGSPSEEMLLRIALNNTYYPYNIDYLSDNKPILKVTLPSSILKHPMRGIIERLRFPTLFLILLASFALVRIGILGYSANIHILGRVILCVLGAVLIPFTSFIFAFFYNLYFSEEYSEHEMQHYTQIQAKIIEKAIESYKVNHELSITELQNTISNLEKEDIKTELEKWLPNSGASLISFNFEDNKEIVITSDNNTDSLSDFAKEVKNLIKIGFDNAFNYDKEKLKNVKDEKELQSKFGFLPNTIGLIFSNIGKIYQSIPNEPNSLYSLFPIYKKKNIIGSVLIKFDTYKLLKKLRQFMPSLFSQSFMGDYIVKNALIPINEDGTLPLKEKIIFSDDLNFILNFDLISKKLQQIASNKIQKTWVSADYIYTANYLNDVNAIIVSCAERQKIKDNSSKNKDIKYIIIYVFFMVVALSVLLCGVIVTPIRILQNASENVAQGNYLSKIDFKSGDEFEGLCNGFNEMMGALLQKEKMSNYVSKEVMNEVSIKTEHQLQPGGEKIPVAVLFCALKGKKELSQYSPEKVTEIISSLIDAVDEISSSYNGQIDKLIEDTVMVVFRKEKTNDNIVLNACRTALAINQRLYKELPDFSINMGLSSGYAVSGKLGSKNGKLDYTVIGNPVNLAARLKVQAYKAKNTGILICPNSIRQIHGAARLNFIERMSIKGRTNRTFPLYELISLRD